MQSFLLGLAKTLFSAKMMVSDDKIAKRLFELLEIADLTTATTSAIRRQLEQELGIDLRDKKAFVREQVNLYLQTHHQNQQEEDKEEATAVKAEAEKDGGEEAAEEDEDEDVEEEEEGEEEEEEVERKPEQDSKRLQAKINRVKKDSLQKEKKKRSGGGGFAKLCRLSPELQSVMGEKELSRTQVVKFLWIYIREKNLQDPGNKRKIICDDALRAVFGTESTDMFKMNKLLTKHIWPLDSLGDEGESKPKRPKIEKKEAPQKEGGKARGGGFMAPLPISEALIQFLGTGESELSRSEVVRRMWAYIKENELQTLQWGPKYGLVPSVQTLFHSRNLDTIFCRGRDTLCSDLACTGTIIPITKELVFPARSDCHAAQKF